jgi:predicted acylesterase/phospholipase RssA/CRP-like cAMP-binding protein
VSRPEQPPPASVEAALAGVPLLAGLAPALRAQLAAEARTVRLAAGDILFREGEPGQSVFVVRFGRLAVVSGDPPVVVSVLRRGSVVGELALLTDQARSATVYAGRNSEVIELGREQFELLVRTEPEFAVALTRSIGRRLAASVPAASPVAPPLTFGVVALDPGAPAAEVCELLAPALRARGTLAVLRREDAGHADDRGALLDRAEREHDRVLLAGDGAGCDDPWTQLCRDEADLVIAVSSGAHDRSWMGPPAALYGCELIVVGGAMPDLPVGLIAPREVQMLAADAPLHGAVDALARRLTGRAVGLVLSGGGARAFAHLGVLDELHAAGVRIDRVGGASMGGLVGGFFASGDDPDTIHAHFEHFFVRQNPTNDYTLPAFSLIRGRKTRRMLEQRFGDVRIEELPRRFYCVSCDLIGRKIVVHRSGMLREALYASLAIPGVYPPVRDGAGRLLVDGGVLDNLPVETMAAAGEGPVIVVDVGQRPGEPAGQSRPRRLGPLGRALAGSDVQLPRIGETLLRTLTVGSADTVQAALRHADLVIAPRVEGVGMLDWKSLDRVREIGRAAARQALAAYDVADLR